MSNYSFTSEGYKWSMWCGCMGFDVTDAVRCHPVITCILHKSHTDSQLSHGGMLWPSASCLQDFDTVAPFMLCCFAVCALSNIKFEWTWFHTRNYICLTPSSIPVSMLKSVRVTCFCFALCCTFCKLKVFGFRFDLSLACFLLVFRTQSAVKNRAAKVTTGRSWAGFCFCFFYFLPCGHLSLWPVMHALPWISGMLRWFLCKSYERL